MSSEPLMLARIAMRGFVIIKRVRLAERYPPMEIKTVILYRSKHHGNTEKLVRAVADAHPEVDLIDVSTLGKKEYPDLSAYTIIGFASGIYYGNLDADVRRIAQECLRDGDNVIAFITYGGENKFNARDLDTICRLKYATLVSVYGCPGFDTMGPFKLVGGMNKGRPNEEDIAGAVAFYERIVEEYGQIVLDERATRDARDAFNAAHPTGGFMADVKHTVGKLTGKGKK